MGYLLEISVYLYSRFQTDTGSIKTKCIAVLAAYGGTSTLLRHLMLVFPLICLLSVDRLQTYGCTV